MEESAIEHSFHRHVRGIKYFSIFAFIVLAAYGAATLYPPERNAHLIRMARVFIKNSDYRNATLSLRQVLETDSSNLDALLLLAETADATGSAEALLWRRRLVELEPEFLRYRVDWV